jgi:hypothetical protein
LRLSRHLIGVTRNTKGYAMTGDNTKDQPEAGDEAERRRNVKEVFERGIIERGEAAVADEHGRLPSGVTHEITGHDAAGRPILKRRRLSSF